MLQLRPRSKSQPNASAFWLTTEAIPTLYASEDFEGTEALLRKEITEGWQEPKGERP